MRDGLPGVVFLVVSSPTNFVKSSQSFIYPYSSIICFYLISPPPVNPLPLSFTRSPSYGFIFKNQILLFFLWIFLKDLLLSINRIFLFYFIMTR
jgi:hypothetical protein